MGVASVDAATAAVLGPAARTQVYIAIPDPDPRATQFGVVGGRMLNLSVQADQIAAVRWWVASARAAFAAHAPRGGATLSGFSGTLEA